MLWPLLPLSKSWCRGAYYARKEKLIGLPIIFLLVKWGQSSPWRSSNSTCTRVVVIYGWECAEIKIQLPQKPLDIGTLIMRPRQQPCCRRLDSLRLDLSIAIGTRPTADMAAKSNTEQNVACLVDKLPRPSCAGIASAASRPLCQNTLLLDTVGWTTAPNHSVNIISRGRRRCVVWAFGAGA